MKKIMFIVLVLEQMLMAQVIQYDQIYPGEIKRLMGVHFFNENEGWITDLRNIYYTSDGGFTLTEKYTTSTTYLDQVYFWNQMEGVVQGRYNYDNRFFLTTSDGGNTWAQSPVSSKHYESFVTPRIWYGVYENTIHKTTNAGISWASIHNASNIKFKQIKFIDTLNGYAVAEVSPWWRDESKIYSTTNGGATWRISLINDMLYQLLVISADTAIACVGYRGEQIAFYITYNGGLNWQKKIFGEDEYIIDIAYKEGVLIFATQGKIFKSTDFGDSFSEILPYYYFSSDRLYFLNKNVFVQWNGYGRYNRTSNGGKSWILSGRTPIIFNNIRFVDSLHGWNTSQYFYSTSDGGKKWEIFFYDIKDFFFFDKFNGYAAISNAFCKTTNGGASWDTLSILPFNSLKKISFPTTYIGFLLFDTNDGNCLIKKTTDGGISWSDHTINNFIPHSINFYNTENGMITGMFRGFYTTDGGISWIENNGKGQCIFYLDSTNVWLGDIGNIRKSSDGGVNFNNISFPDTINISSIYFLNNSLGISGTNHGIFFTQNGGNSWGLDRNYLNTNSISFYNDGKGYIGTNNLFINFLFSDPIPVQLTSFTASVQQNSVHLKWQTSTETNNSGFEVERKVQSAESMAWETIAFIPGSGTTTEPQQYSFIDENVASGSYKYRLKQIDFDGSFEYSKEVEVEINTLPKEFVLFQNYPNPFNPVTKIKYAVPSSLSLEERAGVRSFVTLKVFDILGNEVSTLVNEAKEPGEYEVELDGSSYSSGVYFYTLQAGAFTATKKFVLMK